MDCQKCGLPMEQITKSSYCYTWEEHKDITEWFCPECIHDNPFVHGDTNGSS